VTTPDAALERLVSSARWQPNWGDVLARAGEHPVRKPRLARRRLVLAVALLAAVVVPLAALSAANDWWSLFKAAGVPTPASTPIVVKTGTWSGHPWQLVAYPARRRGLCFGVMPTSTPGSSEGAALECSDFAGFKRSAAQVPPSGMTITFLSGSRSKKLPSYIAGPVIDTARTVEIHFTDGQTLRTQTFTAPAPLNHVRFFATPIPTNDAPSSRPDQGKLVLQVAWVAGLDPHGAIVACLAPSTAKDGVSPRSACA
jgi:hypothetical protein